MKFLIDSHALLWYVDQTQLLSLTSHSVISDPENELLLSAGSIWEIGIRSYAEHVDQNSRRGSSSAYLPNIRKSSASN